MVIERKTPVEVLECFSLALGLAPGEKVPESCIDIYTEYKKMMDICSAGNVLARDIIIICAIAKKYHKSAEEVGKEPPLTEGEEVITVFEDIQVEGKFIEYFDDVHCSVKIDGDAAKFRRVLVEDTKRR